MSFNVWKQPCEQVGTHRHDLLTDIRGGRQIGRTEARKRCVRVPSLLLNNKLLLRRNLPVLTQIL